MDFQNHNILQYLSSRREVLSEELSTIRKQKASLERARQFWRVRELTFKAECCSLMRQVGSEPIVSDLGQQSREVIARARQLLKGP